jgi:hypothetical protein
MNRIEIKSAAELKAAKWCAARRKLGRKTTKTANWTDQSLECGMRTNCEVRQLSCRYGLREALGF